MTDIAMPISPADVQGSAPANRRVRGRFPINCKILLAPLDEEGQPVFTEIVTVFGKDLSQSGVCISHDLPLKRPQFLLSFHADEFGEFIVEAEVAWSRLTAIGLYESGCRMVRKIVAPQLFV